MKIKLSHSHPSALMNYLVTCSSEKRSAFFLECELNLLADLIKKKQDYSEVRDNIYSKIVNYIVELVYYDFGVRGYGYDLQRLDWDLDEFIKLYTKRLT